MSKEFEIKDLWHLRYFLGMEVARSSHGILVFQRKYVLDLLREIEMSGCKLVETPMDPNIKLEARGDGILVDRGKFQRVVGKFIHLTHTHLDISFVVSMVNQFLSNPLKGHMKDVYRILRYLKKDLTKGIMFKKTLNRSLEIYIDADWQDTLLIRNQLQAIVPMYG